MVEAEAAMFGKGPLFEECKQLRRWDEGAKRRDWQVPELEAYRELVTSVISQPPATSAEELLARTSFVREGNRIIQIREDRATATAVGACARL